MVLHPPNFALSPSIWSFSAACKALIDTTPIYGTTEVMSLQSTSQLTHNLMLARDSIRAMRHFQLRRSSHSFHRRGFTLHGRLLTIY